MILYHGTYIDIRSIDLDRCMPYKDFGKGFYLTDIEQQARDMAIRTHILFSKLTAFTVPK